MQLKLIQGIHACQGIAYTFWEVESSGSLTPVDETQLASHRV